MKFRIIATTIIVVVVITLAILFAPRATNIDDASEPTIEQNQ